ncbi:hypothetical protein [Nocardioides pelophilus]|uniref:hypothetical protein n=1 Tax=Nocardioides pelophilus TaxID=2172019 RepID=UPI0015FFC966|nr:hypothetical protein [Nocardioides pelophilus]
MSDYDRISSELAASIRLGYEVEQDDPNFHFPVPEDDEIHWLGSWLASEGWVREAGWAREGGRAAIADTQRCRQTCQRDRLGVLA